MGAALIWREGPDMNVAVSPSFGVVSVNLLQTLLPLHIVVSDGGVITQAGAKLSKITARQTKPLNSVHNTNPK